MYVFLAAGETWHDLMMEHQVPFRLYTYYHLRKKGNKAAMIGDIIRCRAANPHFRFFLDSGAYSMAVDYQKRPHQAINPHEYAREYIDFVAKYGYAFDIVAELDIEHHIDGITYDQAVDWYEELWSHVGAKTLYCWHPHRGPQDWQVMLRNPHVKWVALANDTWKKYGLGKSMQLINQARMAGKYIHGFGQTRINTDVKFTKWTSIDSSSWVQTERYGGIAIFGNNTLKVLSGSGSDRESKMKKRALHKRYFINAGLDFDKIMQEDPPEVRKAVLYAWKALAHYFFNKGTRLGAHLIWNQPPWNAEVESHDDIYNRTVEAMTKKMSKEELENELEVSKERPKSVAKKPLPKAPPGAKQVTSAPGKLKIKLGAKSASSGTENVRMPVTRSAPPIQTPSKTGHVDALEPSCDECDGGCEGDFEHTYNASCDFVSEGVRKEENAPAASNTSSNSNLLGGMDGMAGFTRPPPPKERADKGEMGRLAQHYAPPTLEEVHKQLGITPEVTTTSNNTKPAPSREDYPCEEDCARERAAKQGVRLSDGEWTCTCGAEQAYHYALRNHNKSAQNNSNTGGARQEADNTNQCLRCGRERDDKGGCDAEGHNHVYSDRAATTSNPTTESTTQEGDQVAVDSGSMPNTQQGAGLAVTSPHYDPKVRLPVVQQAAVHAAVKGLPGLACDTCAIMGDCPKFEQGSVCYFQPMFDGLSTRDTNNIMPTIEALADVNLQRAFQAVLQERLVAGGMLDPRVTAQLHSAVGMAKEVLALKTATEKPTQRLTVERHGSTMSVSAEGVPVKKGGGILATLFGAPEKSDVIDVNPEVEEQ